MSLRRTSFVGRPHETLEFVAHKKPVWTRRQCAREFASRGLIQVSLRQWLVAVASSCRRCGDQLMPIRIYTARAIHEIVATDELYERHALVCERLGRAFDDERRIGAVTRAMRALAAPVPTNKQVLYRARNRGRLPCCPGLAPPLLWQLVGTRQLRRHAHNYRYWRPPAHRPYAAWPLVGQIATNVGLTALAQAGIAMWGLLKDLALVESRDELAIREILATSVDRARHYALHMEIDAYSRRAELGSMRQSGGYRKLLVSTECLCSDPSLPASRGSGPFWCVTPSPCPCGTGNPNGASLLVRFRHMIRSHQQAVAFDLGLERVEIFGTRARRGAAGRRRPFAPDNGQLRSLRLPPSRTSG
jgi:hypothetical protein